jgi:hypothetical protein
VIHHISIPVRDPRGAADVLALVLDGRVAQFRPHDGVWTVWTDDEHGTAVECFPRTLAMVPSDDASGVGFVDVPDDAESVAIHALISVNHSIDDLLAIAADAGWRAEVVSRGPHDAVAFWVENSVLLELLTPEMAAEFRRSLRSD